MTVFTVRLLWAVLPHFRQSAVVLVLAAAFGVWTVWVVPRDVGAPYALLFFCQLFAASSGFRPAANAGHFDGALVKGATRQQLALCHWALSSGPGCVAWLVVSAIEVSSLGHRAAMGGDPTSVAGLMVISNVAWVATLPTSRFFGGPHPVSSRPYPMSARSLPCRFCSSFRRPERRLVIRSSFLPRRFSRCSRWQLEWAGSW